jgi:hypothetical protein
MDGRPDESPDECAEGGTLYVVGRLNNLMASPPLRSFQPTRRKTQDARRKTPDAGRRTPDARPAFCILHSLRQYVVFNTVVATRLSSNNTTTPLSYRHFRFQPQRLWRWMLDGLVILHPLHPSCPITIVLLAVRTGTGQLPSSPAAFISFSSRPPS